MLQNLDTMISYAVIMLILSLIITVLVQAVASAFELRGKNLMASLSKVLMQIEPALRSNPDGAAIAKEIAGKVAEHPSLVHFSASAQGKVGGFLARFFARPVKGIEATEWIRLLDEIGSDPDSGLSGPAQKTLTELLSSEVPGVTPERIEQAKRIGSQMATTFPYQAEAVEATVQSAFGSTRKIVVGTEKWFDSVMDRSSDWFTTQTRVWTVCFALGLALLFRVDSFMIIRQLADNPEVRAKLVQSTDQVLEQAKKDIQTGTPAQITVSAMAAEYRDKGDDKEKVLNAVPASSQKTCNDVTTALMQQPLTIGLRTEFLRRCQEQAVKSLQAAAKSLDAYRTQLDSSQLTIITNPFTSPNSTQKPGWIGAIVTGLLLTLGAPFWFNTLSRLSNLRPTIADKLDTLSAIDSLAAGSKVVQPAATIHPVAPRLESAKAHPQIVAAGR
jgi:hypothetical protein